MELKKGYKNTEVGVIPEEWEVKCIFEAFDICNKLRLPISEEVRKTMQGIFPYYGPTRIQDYINEYRVNGEYALIGEDGDHFLKWQNNPMTQLAKGKFNVNNHAHLLKGKNGISTTEWFYHYFKHSDITQHLTRQGAGRYKLSKASLVKIPCAIPNNIEEQTAIATVLSDTDNLIQALEKKIAKKRLIKQGAMQKLLKPKEGWEVKTIKDICDYQNGTSLERFFNNKSGLKVISIGNYSPKGKFVTTHSYISSKYILEVSKFILKKDELTMILNDKTSVGTIIGRVLLIDKDNEYVFNQRTMRLKPKENILPLFLYFLINSDLIHNKIVKLAKPGTQIYVNTDDITQLELTYPKSLKEQTHIATILSDMDTEIEALEKKLAKYKEVKQGLMQNLLTGKIRLV